MANYLDNKNTVTTLQASVTANGGIAANLLPVMWKKGAEIGEQNGDFFQEFEGKGKMSPIRVETDFTKDAGQKLVFRTQEGLYGDGVIGDELIGNDGMEEWEMGEYSLIVDYIRHGTRHTKRTEDQLAMRSELEAGKNEALGNWLGRKKTKHLSMMFREKLHASSHVLASDGTDNPANIDLIKSDNIITYNGLVTWATQLGTLGGKSAQVDTDMSNNPIKKYVFVAVNEALAEMKKSSDYKQAVREAGPREQGKNPLFKGGYVTLDGHIIKEYTPLDHAGRGAIGSALNGKALLGAAGVPSLTISGGGNATKAAVTTAKYFEFFPLYAYRFTPADVLTTWTGYVPGAKFYIIIYNLTGADAGKWGFYRISANNGNLLTIDTAAASRLAAAISSPAHTTVGGVTWSGTVNTETHPAGSIILHTNSLGVPLARSFLLGADAAKRGYGRYRNERATETHEGNFVMDTFIMSVFGQEPTQRTDKRTPNALCITHAWRPAGLAGLPVIA